MALQSSSSTRGHRPLLALGVLAISLVLSACAPRQAQPAAQTPREAPPVPVTAQPVQRGDIQQALPYSGDIRAKSQITVLPKASGRVEKILVDVGSKVQAGDTIAELEQDSPEIQVLQARAALAGAQAKLAQVQRGARSEDVGIAGAALQAQQAALQAAQARLELLELGGRSEDVTNAQVAQAQAGLDAAQAKLAQLKKGATNDKRQQAQSQLETARAQLASALAAQSSLEHELTASAQQAQLSYDTAVAQLASARAQLDTTATPIQAVISAKQATVAAQQASLNSANAARTANDAGYGLNAACAKNDGGGRKDPSACEAALQSGAAAIDSAQKALDAAQDDLNLTLKGGSPATQAQLRAAVASADAAVRNAKTQLDVLNGGSLDKQRKAAQAQVVSAQENVKTAQANLDQVNVGPLPEEIQQAEAAVQQAEQQLNLATLGGVTEQDLRAQRAQVEQLRQAVAQARFQLQKAQNPYTEQDLQGAQAGVDQAQAQLDLATLGFNETTVLAPVDGVIAERQVSPGALVSQSTPIVTLVPPALELVVNVEEAQLGQVAEGQPVTLQVSAFPSQTFSGTVKAIAPTVDTKSRTAAVRIEPRDDGGKLRAGMFARLSIVTAARQNALVVPREAVLEAAPGAQTTVVTIEGNRVKKQPVRLGLVGDKLVEIVSGVTEGQLLATSGLANLSDGDVVAPQVETKTALAQ